MQDVTSSFEALGRCMAAFPAIRVAYVFGSGVSGHPRPSSDLDVALGFDPGTLEIDRLAIKLDVIAAVTDELGALGEKLDLADLETASSAIAFRAVRDGVLVYQRSKSARVETVARVCARAADDAYYRQRNEHIALKRLFAARSGAP
jgi:predicted nucleotidyltransferase